MLTQKPGFLDNIQRDYLLKWTTEHSPLSEKLLKAVFDPRFQILGDSQLLLRVLRRQLQKESCLASLQVCLCTPSKSFHYYRKFLQDPQILFGNHRFKTYPPVNKSFTVKYTQEVSQYLLLSLFSFFGHRIIATLPVKKEGILTQSIASLQDTEIYSLWAVHMGCSLLTAEQSAPPSILSTAEGERETHIWEKSRGEQKNVVTLTVKSIDVSHCNFTVPPNCTDYGVEFFPF